MDTVLVTAVTVLKVLMAASIGSVMSFALPEQTVRDLNFLNGNVFSPLFSFSSLVGTLTWELVVMSWAMFVFALVTLFTAQGVGWFCATWFCSDTWMCDLPVVVDPMQQSSSASTRRRNVFKTILEGIRTPSPCDYKTMYLITLGTQNTGTFPIALLFSLVGSVDWFNQAAYTKALSVIFVYTSLWTVFIWSISLWTVRRGARQRRRALQAREVRCRVEPPLLTEALRHSASEQDLTAAVPKSSTVAASRDSCSDDSDTNNLSMVDVLRGYTTELLDVNESITVMEMSSTSSLQHHHAAVRSAVKQREDDKSQAAASSVSGAAAAVVAVTASLPSHVVFAQAISRVNPPILASALGIIMSLLPPGRWLLSTPPLQIIVGGMALVGDGCVPVSLFVLGSNLTTGGLGPLKKIDIRYLVVGTIAKVLVQPALNILVFFLFDYFGWLPSDRVIRIAIWVELIAPSAIMSTVICRLENYMAECATGLLLVQYVSAVVTTTMWLALFMHTMT